jgi:hypothetical protein
MPDEIFSSFISQKDIEEQQPQDSARDIWMKNYSEQIFSTDNISVKTDINTRQIMALSKGLIFAERYNSKLMLGLCNQIMILSVSRDRKSRKEFTEVTKSINGGDDGNIIPSLKERLLG